LIRSPFRLGGAVVWFKDWPAAPAVHSILFAAAPQTLWFHGHDLGGLLTDWAVASLMIFSASKHSSLRLSGASRDCD